MNYPAASCGVSKAHHASDPNSVTPNVFIGVQARTRLDSRLKHAGVTTFGRSKLRGTNLSEIQFYAHALGLLM